jgi:hypothetical protein
MLLKVPEKPLAKPLAKPRVAKVKKVAPLQALDQRVQALENRAIETTKDLSSQEDLYKAHCSICGATYYGVRCDHCLGLIKMVPMEVDENGW